MPDRSNPNLTAGRSESSAALVNNVVSLAGFFLMAIALLLLATFALFSVVSPSPNPYVDIIGYLVLPGLFIGGLLIVPVGMFFKARQLKRDPGRAAMFRFPELNFNDPKHRRAIAAFVALNLIIVLPVVGVTSYHGYHYTDSTEFCAKVCHSVMQPQATTYDHSPHARVSCAECHIGSGASWFVKSKLSGVRQVWAVWADSFSRPIPPAITELRPARETCEECHWPAKFFGSQLAEVVHFAPDEDNTKRLLKMVLKTGGADESIGRIEGIHMHMAFSGPIEYVATDEHLQHIPWVRYTKPTGEVLIYRSDGLSADDTPPEGIRRTVDCMDCHNRGAHHFRSPQQAVDLHLTAGLIDATLPFIKREAVAALDAEYDDKQTALRAIEERLLDFYRANYPALLESRKADVAQAVESVREIYRENFFPEMNVTWRTYPDNIGHLTSPGCFRCHDGRHVNQHGVPISSDCDVCHTFLEPVPGRPDTFVEGPYEHSMSLYLHENLRCEQCHTGGSLPTCGDCHATGEWLDERGNPRFRPVEPP